MFDNKKNCNLLVTHSVFTQSAAIDLHVCTCMGTIDHVI